MKIIQARSPLVFVNFVLFVGVVIINALAVTLPINGKSTGELSDKYPNLFVPAGVTFSIWGVIYLLLLIFVSYQLWCFWDTTKRKSLDQNGQLLFGATCLFNMAWILAWHYEMIFLSVTIMLFFLAALIFLFLKIEGIRDKTWYEIISLKIPISIYLGWICVATIANITALLVSIGWQGGIFSEVQITIIMLITGASLAILMLFKRKNIPYALVIIWAYYGIYLKRENSDHPEIGKYSLGLIIFISFVILFIAIKSYRKKRLL